jgi:hypothetical protein
MRRAARTDANQAEIMAALKRVGVSCEYIKQPFDLVVYNPRRAETAFVECKNPERTSKDPNSRLTKAQLDFISRWPGKIYVVRSAEDAVRQVLGEEVMT